MASGLQAASKPSSNSWTTLFTASTGIVINISACNRAGSTTDVSIAAVPNGDTRGTQHEIESGTDVAASSVIERTGIVLKTGDKIDVTSVNGDVSFVCWGVELS
jgi:hypothetical protein